MCQITSLTQCLYSFFNNVLFQIEVCASTIVYLGFSLSITSLLFIMSCSTYFLQYDMPYSKLNLPWVPTHSKTCYPGALASGITSRILLVLSKLLLPYSNFTQEGSCLPSSLSKAALTETYTLWNLRRKCTVNPNNYFSTVSQEYKVTKV